MSLAYLEHALRSRPARPRCVRVNLRLWFALKSANLIAQREVPLNDALLTGLRLPHLGEVLLVLDPDLGPAGFVIEEGRPAPAPQAPQALQPTRAPLPPSPGARAESAFDRRWMGRY